MTGLTISEERELAEARARRLQAALDVAMRGLAAARDSGFADANGYIAEANEALSKAPSTGPHRLGSWISRLVHPR
jgi:hypothetical protein